MELVVTLPDYLILKLALLAHEKGLTLNEYCVQIIDAAIEREESEPPEKPEN
jgi:hypothetical protein